jgi:EPS-associated MarR family transcriptional regulator
VTPISLSDELRYRLLNHLAEHPDASQRDVARELGISVGKVNYCVNALIRKGLLKVRNFKNSHNKSAYLYILTPKGIEEKINVTYQWLRLKMAEYDTLKDEIERLTVEVRELEQRSDS